jgi:hypothetical protein
MKGVVTRDDLKFSERRSERSGIRDTGEGREGRHCVEAGEKAAFLSLFRTHRCRPKAQQSRHGPRKQGTTNSIPTLRRLYRLNATIDDFAVQTPSGHDAPEGLYRRRSMFVGADRGRRLAVDAFLRLK